MAAFGPPPGHPPQYVSDAKFCSTFWGPPHGTYLFPNEGVAATLPLKGRRKLLSRDFSPIVPRQTHDCPARDSKAMGEALGRRQYRLLRLEVNHIRTEQCPGKCGASDIFPEIEIAIDEHDIVQYRAPAHVLDASTPKQNVLQMPT